MSSKRFKWPTMGLACLVLAIGCGGGAAQAQRLRADITKEKSSDALRSVFQGASASANQSTVAIKMDDAGTMRQIALGTIVSEDGFILTKASEVTSRAKIWVPLMIGHSVRNYDVKVVGVSNVLDLAMLKIDAKGLTPVIFADTRPGVPDAPPITANDAATWWRGKRFCRWAWVWRPWNRWSRRERGGGTRTWPGGQWARHACGHADRRHSTGASGRGDSGRRRPMGRQCQFRGLVQK